MNKNKKYRVCSHKYTGRYQFGDYEGYTYEITFNKSLEHTGRIKAIVDGLNSYNGNNDESVFSKEDLKNAFNAGADKRNWTDVKLTGVVSGDDFTLLPIFDEWFNKTK